MLCQDLEQSPAGSKDGTARAKSRFCIYEYMHIFKYIHIKGCGSKKAVNIIPIWHSMSNIHDSHIFRGEGGGAESGKEIEVSLPPGP